VPWSQPEINVLQCRPAPAAVLDDTPPGHTELDCVVVLE
jgi:hypothetical protein